jgi:[pyruvate, water dikinase]-phosphate phosphotransferase / [pyruvate, water dikinase] kinase
VVEGEERIETGHPPAVPVFFLSDSTGISAETMGNALLIQFPDLRFERRLIPFITSVEVRQELLGSKCPLIDFFGMHMEQVEPILGAKGIRVAARLHGMGDVKRYNARMAAVEYAIEHDDGQSMRALDKADVILLAPSRCGKTPTTMYLALQHGIFVANYPLVDEDFASAELPGPVRKFHNRCFGLTTTPARLSQVRHERRPNSRYASLEQCMYELRQAEAMYRNHRLPVINSSTKSVEEMSTVILQTLNPSA